MDGGPRFVSSKKLEHYDFSGLRAFLALLNGELYVLTFFEATETVTLNGGEMNKHIGAIFTSQKAITFCAVKPLYCTFYTF